MFLPRWLSGLKCPSTGTYRLLGGARPWWKNGGPWEGSCPWVLPRTTVTSVFMPAVSQSCPRLCQYQQETLQYHPVGLAQTPVRSLPFPLGPEIDLQPVCDPYVCHVPIQVTWDLVGTLQKWSFCFPSALEFLWSNPGLERQRRGSGGPSSWCQNPRLESLTQSSEFSLLWENPCDTIIFQFCRSPTW